MKDEQHHERRNMRTLQDVEDVEGVRDAERTHRTHRTHQKEQDIKRANINARDERKARVLNPALIVEHEERDLVVAAIRARKGPAA